MSDNKIPIKIGIIGGSGLGDAKILDNVVEKSVTTPFGKPSSTLIQGTIDGVDCVFLSRHGRKHTIAPSKVNFRANIWALKEIGCTHVLVSSACGSLQEEVAPGDLVVPDSFIDLTKHRISSLYNNDGPHPDTVVHIPMCPAFCNETRNILIQAAEKNDIKCRDGGTTVVIEGPRFSTLAESHVYRSWGAHLVNMTLAPEVTLAKEAGLCYACVAMATDYDCWNESSESVNVENVLKTFQQNVEKVKIVLLQAVKDIAARNWDQTITDLRLVVKNSIQSQH